MIRAGVGPLAAPLSGTQMTSTLRASSCSSGYFTESNNVTRESLNFEHIKCVLLGDGAVGKTSLIISYTTNGYPSDYTPTTFDTFKVDVKVEEKPVHLEICDTAGQEDFDALRPLCYAHADAFLLCFSVVSPSSFANIKHKWYPELKKYGPSSVPVILVGTQSDLRDDVKIAIDLANVGEKPVSESQAMDLAKSVNAVSYIECSALTVKNLKTVFDTALLVAIEHQCEARESKIRNNNNNDYNVSKQHSSSSRFSALSSSVPKKKSQSTSSSSATTNVGALLQSNSSGNSVGIKLSASSSCTSPPFILNAATPVSHQLATPRPNRTNGVAAASLTVTNKPSKEVQHTLPTSPSPRSRHKFQAICCLCV